MTQILTLMTRLALGYVGGGFIGGLLSTFLAAFGLGASERLHAPDRRDHRPLRRRRRIGRLAA